MLVNGKLQAIRGNQVTVDLDEPINRLRVSQLADGCQPSVSLDIADGRSISPDQRKKIFAMIGDYADFTGYEPEEMEAWLKWFYQAKTGIGNLSMATMSKEQANKFLTFVIDFGFENGIPWKTKHLDSIPSSYPLIMQCLKHRMCVICGKHADIDHEPPIGSSGNRHNIDNRRYKFLPLCRIHHTIRHQIGIDSFMSLYHIKPVKLDDPTLISLRLNTQTQFDQFDGKEASRP
ncbi:hypothetical protein HWN39_10550 [Lactobacillus rhamnosus]|uniref:DUF968 domain-containing protein n=1 Tax=Lacticaseibacillus rhamnosus TaxID=47715 RepID=A0A7Y7QII1_LACRH|nr:putative HNHc nuclease [Lacticaseibacillus rhamnosus]NVO88918.1 hypothetical protein [Lacticaseibacillus rhamnosus]